MSRKSKNLEPVPFPVLSWVSDEAALSSLAAVRDWCVRHSTMTIGWYLTRKGAQRRWSRSLRLSTILLFGAGTVSPLVAASSDLRWQLQLGYLFLAGGAITLAVDRFFGISSAWMRCIATSLRLQKSLTDFEFCWELAVTERLEPYERTAKLLQLAADFAITVHQEALAETDQWTEEFEGNIAELRLTAQRSQAQQ